MNAKSYLLFVDEGDRYAGGGTIRRFDSTRKLVRRKNFPNYPKQAFRRNQIPAQAGIQVSGFRILGLLTPGT